MDIFNIQALIKEGKIVGSADINLDNSYLQVGVYQPGNRKRGPSDANSYPSFAIPLSELGGGNVTPQFQYEIGQYVAAQGGVIANRWLSNSAGGSPTSGTIQNYLVVDIIDLATGAEWATSYVDIPNVESTWNGKANTIVLINAGVAGGITTGTAAQLCEASINGGKNDWYLPAIDELYKVWNNRWEIAQGLEIANGSQLIFNNYWSSTQYVTSYAWFLNFYLGITDANAKDVTYSVRAVRQFSI
jgi:hypothetical protein